MKKIGLLFLVISINLVFAQANRFIYEVTMKTDSTDRNTVKNEVAYLDIFQGNSVFYSENRVKRDSLIAKARQTGNFNFDRTQMQSLRSNMNYIIEKDAKSNKKLLKARIMQDEYVYEEDRPMDWKILSETATIGEYKTQKAETNFAGRKWIAWFTTDVPVQDGPYKFAGLPGLIVKVEDSKGDYSFDLKESKKIRAIATFEQRGSPINVKRAVFEKQQKQFQDNPIAAMATMGNRNARIQMDPNQLKQMEERRKEENRKNNNPIELK